MERDSSGRLVAHVAGRDEPIVDVRVARCFPWSAPECFVSIRDKDGKEICLLKTPGELDRTDRELIEEELARKVFNPKILKVLSCDTEFGVTSVHAETDRGEVTFQIREREAVRALSEKRALFRDVDGNTYELTDINEMDSASQRMLHRFF